MPHVSLYSYMNWYNLFGQYCGKVFRKNIDTTLHNRPKDYTMSQGIIDFGLVYSTGFISDRVKVFCSIDFRGHADTSTLAQVMSSTRIMFDCLEQPRTKFYNCFHSRGRVYWCVYCYQRGCMVCQLLFHVNLPLKSPTLILGGKQMCYIIYT